MTTYPKLNKELELSKIKTRDDGIKNSKYQTKKRDYDNILKSKIDNDFYRKK